MNRVEVNQVWSMQTNSFRSDIRMEVRIVTIDTESDSVTIEKRDRKLVTTRLSTLQRGLRGARLELNADGSKPESMRVQVARLKQEGLNTPAIAKKLGCSASKVWEVLRTINAVGGPEKVLREAS